jgi:hypothetical protein
MAKQTIPVRSGYVKHRPKTERRAWVRFTKDEEICCRLTNTSGKAESDTAWLGRVRDEMTEHYIAKAGLTHQVQQAAWQVAYGHRGIRSRGSCV